MVARDTRAGKVERRLVKMKRLCSFYVWYEEATNQLN